MLESMRRGAQTWVAKLLFGLLVLSFSVWGVADVFTGWGRGAVATVGSQAITADEFSRQFQSELDRFSEQAKTRLTAEQGRALGLDRRVLNQLMANAAFESHAAQLGLSLSDATVADLVANDPDFVGPDGKFSRMAFDSILRQIGLSEQAFIALRRRDEIRNQLLGAFVKGQTVSKPMIELMHAYENETRVIEYVNVNPDKVPAVTEPDDAKLKELYEAGKSQYMTPELKKFEVLMLTVDDLKKTIEVSDEDIAKTFEATKDSYSVPEQRRIQQIAFKDKAAADAAKVALDGGKSFGDVAKDAGAKDTDADLGLIAKKSLIDKTIADAAFALEKDKISDVIVGRFATVLLRVTQIEPGVVKTLADVKDQVKDKLASEKARTALQDKHDDIDDNRNAGKTLKDIADSMKLTYKEIAGADKNGMMLDGKPALETPDLRKIMTNVFAPDA
ncbi:MAG: SurA N-terminal domain-containing protein, partial [Hyphomicrobium sp.]